MSNAPNYLKIYRKRSTLTQEDIAFLMRIPDYSNISRYEKGQRTPTMELLLVYHHLFETSIESFFEPESKIILAGLLERITELINELKREGNNTGKNTPKINFLEQTFKRLTN